MPNLSGEIDNLNESLRIPAFFGNRPVEEGEGLCEGDAMADGAAALDDAGDDGRRERIGGGEGGARGGERGYSEGRV